jgi:hypothetical protein
MLGMSNNISNINNPRRTISELSLDEVFGRTLTDTSCVYVDKGREVWVATEMCAQYLESSVDSILVQNDGGQPLGIVGGYDLLDHLRKNPTRESQYLTKIGEIMFTDLPQIQRETKLGDLIDKWTHSRRAFAYLPNESGDYSPISARKILEIGMRYRFDFSISSMPKTKTMVSFHRYDTLGNILDLMFENKTRKLLLQDSKQFISDRLILGEVSRILKFQENFEYFLDLPVKQLQLGYAREISEDVSLSRLCSLMDKMDHPYIIYKGDTAITPWDICLALRSDGGLIEPLSAVMDYSQQRTIRTSCPHCGKEI